jgi:Abnormal spindle-like microcephaly-assoc'd, ASPM-SPD-2-Hydin
LRHVHTHQSTARRNRHGLSVIIGLTANNYLEKEISNLQDIYMGKKKSNTTKGRGSRSTRGHTNDLSQKQLEAAEALKKSSQTNGMRIVMLSKRGTAQQDALLTECDGISAVAFGVLSVGSVIQQILKIKNMGETNLSCIVISMSGVNAAEFTVTSHPSTKAAPGGSIAPGGYATFIVNFTPVSVGEKTATIRIAGHDSIEHVSELNLTGTAVAPEIAVERVDGTSLLEGSSIALFGGLAEGKRIQGVTIRNTGSAYLNGIVIGISGTDAADFSVTSHPSTKAAPGGSLAPGGFATFAVNFTPTSAGEKCAIIRITSNDTAKNPFDIHLTGTC